jgi:hypothetical protein
MKIPTISLAPRALDDAMLPDAGARLNRRVRRTRGLRRMAAWALAAAVLGLVFASYRSPDMMFMLATQLWSCF